MSEQAPDAPAGPRTPRAKKSLDAASLPVSVWVRLLKAHSLVSRQLRRRLPEGLTLPQLDVLTQLARHEREWVGQQPGVTASDLSRKLLMSGGNLTVIVDSLSRAGLVERRRGAEDRRTVLVRLTERGRVLVAEQLPRHREAVAALLAAMPTRDLNRLRSLLGELLAALERQP